MCSEEALDLAVVVLGIDEHRTDVGLDDVRESLRRRFHGHPVILRGVGGGGAGFFEIVDVVADLQCDGRRVATEMLVEAELDAKCAEEAIRDHGHLQRR